MSKFQIAGYEVEFPFQPYGVQLAMMGKVISTLKKSQHALLESPTGSGKSLSLLCSVLAWQKDYKQKEMQRIKDLYAGANNNNSNDEAAIANGGGFLTEATEEEEEEEEEDADDDDGGEDEYSEENNAHEEKEVAASDDDFEPNDDDDFEREPASTKKKKRKPESQPKAKVATRKKMKNAKSASQPTPTPTPTPLNQVNLSVKNEIINKIAERKAKVPKIYYATRTHSQIAQVVRELERTSYRPQMVILGSREQYCINRAVNQKPNKNEECKKLLEKGSCQFFKRTKRLHRATEIRPGGKHEVWDIEDLVKLGKEKEACPYFAAHELLTEAELVFCPYNYIVDPIIRRTMEIDISGSVVILDEAHNIEDVSRSSASITLTSTEIEDAYTDVLKLIDANFHANVHTPLFHMLKKIHEWMSAQPLVDSDYERKHKVLSNSKQVEEMLTEIGVDQQSFEGLKEHCIKALTLSAEPKSFSSKKELQKPSPTEKLSTKTMKILEGILTVFEFMYVEDKRFFDDFKVVVLSEVKRDRKGSYWETSFNLWCMNPAVAFTEIQRKARTIILTSGTLAPMDSFASELGVEFSERLEAQHVVDVKKQVLIGSIDQGPSNVKLNSTFKHADSFAFQDSLGELLLSYCNTIEFGILCFFPSYSLLDKLQKRWTETGLWKKIKEIKEVSVEPRGKSNSSEESFEKEMNRFYKGVQNYEKLKASGKPKTSAKKNGSIFFAVCRGKVSEGINFSDNYARAVIVIGIPFANVKDLQIRLKKTYNDEARSAATKKQRLNNASSSSSSSSSKELLSGDQWYKQQAFRALNQAIGRCIRHKNDYGAIILVGEGFNDQRNVPSLSKWVRGNITHFNNHDDSLRGLQEFFKRLAANPSSSSSSSGASFSGPSASQASTSSSQLPLTAPSQPQITQQQQQSPPSSLLSKSPPTRTARITITNPEAPTSPPATTSPAARKSISPSKAQISSFLSQFQYVPRSKDHQPVNQSNIAPAAAAPTTDSATTSVVNTETDASVSVREQRKAFYQQKASQATQLQSQPQQTTTPLDARSTTEQFHLLNDDDDEDDDNNNNMPSQELFSVPSQRVESTTEEAAIAAAAAAAAKQTPQPGNNDAAIIISIEEDDDVINNATIIARCRCCNAVIVEAHHHHHHQEQQQQQHNDDKQHFIGLELTSQRYPYLCKLAARVLGTTSSTSTTTTTTTAAAAAANCVQVYQLSSSAISPEHTALTRSPALNSGGGGGNDVRYTFSSATSITLPSPSGDDGDGNGNGASPACSIWAESDGLVYELQWCSGCLSRNNNNNNNEYGGGGAPVLSSCVGVRVVASDSRIENLATVGMLWLFSRSIAVINNRRQQRQRTHKQLSPASSSPQQADEPVAMMDQPPPPPPISQPVRSKYFASTPASASASASANNSSSSSNNNINEEDGDESSDLVRDDDDFQQDEDDTVNDDDDVHMDNNTNVVYHGSTTDLNNNTFAYGSDLESDDEMMWATTTTTTTTATATTTTRNNR